MIWNGLICQTVRVGFPNVKLEASNLFETIWDVIHFFSILLSNLSKTILQQWKRKVSEIWALQSPLLQKNDLMFVIDQMSADRTHKHKAAMFLHFDNTSSLRFD